MYSNGAFVGINVTAMELKKKKLPTRQFSCSHGGLKKKKPEGSGKDGKEEKRRQAKWWVAKRKASKGKEKRGKKDEEQDDQERHQSRKSQTEAQPVTSNPPEGREECHTALVFRLTLLITTPPRWSAERLTRSVRRSLRTAGASAELAHISRRHSVQRTFTVLSISALTFHEQLTRANLFELASFFLNRSTFGSTIK